MLPVIIIFLFTLIEIKNQIDWLSLDGHDFTGQVDTLLASLTFRPGSYPR